MGSFLDKPRTETNPEVMEGKDLTCALVSMQGWRVTQEDAHVMQLGVPGHDDVSWFGVFDGHGGSLISNEAAKRLLGKIDLSSTEPEALQAAMRKGFLECDAEMRKMDAIQRGDDHSGSTAITAFVTPTHIVTGNCGDSRAILVASSGVKPLSFDHKPYNEAEAKRITEAGGTVTMRRVNGDLAVSRALGDYVYKHSRTLPAEKQQVSPEPEFTVHKRDAATDQFLVLACDGIWDVMENDEVGAFLQERVAAGVDNLGELADCLVRECLRLGSRDNMSVVLVALPAAPKPTPEAIAAYKKSKVQAEAAASEEEEGDVQVEGAPAGASGGVSAAAQG
ncbi:Ppm1a [Symbiodinium sp. KB8]|nr:Ppm1a [Symbiodinium sp. KB8]